MPVAITAVVGGIGYVKLASSARATQQIYANRLQPIEYLSAANAALLVTRGDAWRMLQETELSDRRKMESSIAQQSKRLEDQMALYSGLNLNARERELLTQFRSFVSTVFTAAGPGPSNRP